MAGGAQGEKGSAEAWQGAFDRTHTRVGHHLDGWLQWTRAYLKPTLTSVALRMTRGASRVKKHPRPAWARRSKPGLSECRLVAGIGRAKSQIMLMTCSRAAAMDGSAIGRRRGSLKNVCLKRLRTSGFRSGGEGRSGLRT